MNFPKNTVKQLMKSHTDLRVSEKSIVEADRWLGKMLKALVETSEIITFKDGRTTISYRDVAIAEINTISKISMNLD